MNGVIYKVTNKINDKIYIGKTTQKFNKRIIQHKSDIKNNKKNMYFHRVLLKHGYKNFRWEIIFNCLNEKELNQMEKYFIACYGATDYLYNMTEGGEGTSGYRHTKEAIKKIALSSKRKYPKEFCDKISKRMQGNKRGLGTKRTPESCKKISIALTGKKPSEETRLKMSEKAKGRAGYWTGKKRNPPSEETRLKMSESRKKYCEMMRNA